MSFTLAFLLLSLLVSCRTSVEPKSTGKTVFDTDDRRPWRELDPGLRKKIGILKRGKGSCTASLVGPKHILTNAHCAFESDGKRKSGEFCFYINYRDHRKKSFALGGLGSSGGRPKKPKDCQKVSSHIKFEKAVKAKLVSWGTQTPAKERFRDWAILELEKPIGDELGYLKTKNFTDSDLNGLKVTLAGYSYDFRNLYGEGSFHSGCVIKYTAESLLRHNCDTYTGASGSPVLFSQGTDFYIVGLHAASSNTDCKPSEKEGSRCKNGVRYRDAIANKAVFAREFHEAIKNYNN